MHMIPSLYRVKVKGEEAKPNGGMNEFDFFSNYIPETQRNQTYFQRCKDEIPFDTMRWNGFRLPQLAFLYDLSRDTPNKIPILDELISKLEKDYGCNVVSVWCNLFEDGDHHIDWHQDQYGCHTFVLSFGSPRKVLYRKKRGLLSSEKILAEHTTTNGDMYYFSPVWDKKTEHCVPKMKESVGPSISLVFFVSRPFTSNKWGTVLRLLAS